MSDDSTPFMDAKLERMVGAVEAECWRRILEVYPLEKQVRILIGREANRAIMNFSASTDAKRLTGADASEFWAMVEFQTEMRLAASNLTAALLQGQLSITQTNIADNKFWSADHV